MSDFLVLLTQIFIISCLQSILEVFINAEDKPYQGKLLNVTCFIGSLYLLMEFISDNIISQLSSMMGVFR